jgi:predicted nucleotidyltransferase
MPQGVDFLADMLFEPSDSPLHHGAAIALAKHAAAGRVDWSKLPIERVEKTLVSADEPCPHMLDALRGLVDAREVRGLNIPPEGRIKRALAGVLDRVATMFIFGSYAKGQQSLDSDVDLMVIGDVSLRELAPDLKRVEQELGRQVNVVIYAPDEFRKRVQDENPFVKEVMRGEKLFVMGGQDELAAMAR